MFVGYLRKRTFWDRLRGKQWRRLDMRDEGDLRPMPSKRRLIIGIVLATAVVYVLLTAALVFLNG
jgi:hypothetical protein